MRKKTAVKSHPKQVRIKDESKELLKLYIKVISRSELKFFYNTLYNIPLQWTYDKTLFPSHVQKTIYHSFDVTTMFKK